MDSDDDFDREYKILLVEDDLLDAQLVCRHLEPMRRPRFQVEVASTLREACERLVHASFDTVLLDLHLPDSVGLETVDDLKTVWSSGPIIVLTGLDEDCLGVDAIRHGVQDYLSKDGLSANLLSRAIRYAVERSSMDYWLQASKQSQDYLLIDFCDKLREPLSKLLYAASDLYEKGPLPPQAAAPVETVKDCAIHLTELIDQAARRQLNEASSS